jgi:hypothetical protein
MSSARFSLLAIVLELVLVLDFCHWLARASICVGRKSNKLVSAYGLQPGLDSLAATALQGQPAFPRLTLTTCPLSG